MKSIVKSAAVATSLALTPLLAAANETVRLMEEFYEVADSRPFDMAALKSFYAEDFVDHNPHPALPSETGLVFQFLASGAPDSRHDIEMIVPSGENMAVVVWRYIGTNTDGLFNIPVRDPALPFDIAGIEVWKSKNGKLTDLWHVEDIAGLTAQLASE